MIRLDDPNCIGCAACASVCPRKCIVLVENKEGFLYPNIDSNKCIDCGMCESVCIINNNHFPVSDSISYAAYSKNDEQRCNSSSGAIFYELANYVLNNHGVVYGAAFDNEWLVKHSRCDSTKDLWKLQTSKYVQSSTVEIFDCVENDLKNELLVLFCGTPCQCNALKLFLGKEFSNLLLVDFICHGVPSPKVWKKYIESITGSEIQRVNFRDKSSGWRNYKLCISTFNDSIVINYFESPYMKLFLNDLILRTSCYSCKSKFPNKSADITIGDLWGAENILKENDDDKGISFVSLNTNKGKDFVNRIKERIVCYSIDQDLAFSCNPSAIKSAKMPPNRERLFEYINNKSNVNFDVVAKKFIKSPNIVFRIIGRLRLMIISIIKR